jgi:hypothetical protein
MKQKQLDNASEEELKQKQRKRYEKEEGEWDKGKQLETLKRQKKCCEEKQRCVFSSFASAVDDVGLIKQSAF